VLGQVGVGPSWCFKSTQPHLAGREKRCAEGYGELYVCCALLAVLYRVLGSWDRRARRELSLDTSPLAWVQRVLLLVF
jgi:hypothetical protein